MSLIPRVTLWIVTMRMRRGMLLVVVSGSLALENSHSHQHVAVLLGAVVHLPGRRRRRRRRCKSLPPRSGKGKDKGKKPRKGRKKTFLGNIENDVGGDVGTVDILTALARHLTCCFS